MPARFIDRTKHCVDFSDSDLRAFQSLDFKAKRFEPRQPLAREGDTPRRVLWIQRGWALRQRRLADGRVQTLNFVLPGELVDPVAVVGGAMDHGVAALSEVQAVEVRLPELKSAMEAHPRLLTAMLAAALMDAAILREHLVQIARGSARERVAFLIASLLRRQALAGGPADRLETPVGHGVLADTLGLSRVHVSRVLKSLREGGLIGQEARQLTVLDLDGLARLARHDDRYLKLGLSDTG